MFVLALVSTVIALGALVLAAYSLRRSGEALEEARLAPLRTAQHELLPVIKRCARLSRRLLTEDANYGVQSEPLDAEALRGTAKELWSTTELMTEQTIADPRLEAAVKSFRVSVFGNSRFEPTGLRDSFDRYVSLAERIAEARQRPGNVTGTRDELMRLGAERGGLQERVRELISASLSCLDSVDERVDEVEHEGFGRLANAKQARPGHSIADRFRALRRRR